VNFFKSIKTVSHKNTVMPTNKDVVKRHENRLIKTEHKTKQ